MLTDQQELWIASYLRALAILFEGEAENANPIQYQAIVGWDADQVGERCRLIDANDCSGVFALFDPSSIEKGPAWIGVCIRDHEMVRLELGTLWLRGNGDRAVLVTAKGRSHLLVEEGRFVENLGKPIRDPSRGTARARLRLAELATESKAIARFMIAA